MNSRAAFWAVLLAAAAAGAILRVRDLGSRPLHTDEAVQAVKFGKLLEEGQYTYNPREYHGPTLYYLTVPWARAQGIRTLDGMSEVRLRMFPALFSVATILLIALFAPVMGRGAAAVGAILMAVHPFLIYYSRYYIQESLLVFFTAAAVGCGWRYARRPAAAWAAGAGLAAGMMFATKETAALAYAAMAAGLLAAGAAARGADGRRRWRVIAPAHAAIFVAMGVAAAVAFFSSFFTHGRGVWDSIAAFVFFADRAGGAGHEKPWWTYFNWLFAHRAGGLGVWSQWVLPCFGVAAVWVVGKGGRKTEDGRRQMGDGGAGSDAGRWIAFARFIVVFTAVLFVLYSIIPYKTPWLMLTPIWGLCLVAGVGVQTLWRTGGWTLRLAAALTLAAGVFDLYRQSGWINGRYAADERNPCAYEHTSTDLLNGVRIILDAAAASPDGADTLVRVLAGEYWPLPWYLRGFTRVGYWTEIPDAPDAPIVIALPSDLPVIEARLKDRYVTSIAGLRPGVALYILVREDLWARLMDRRSGGVP